MGMSAEVGALRAAAGPAPGRAAGDLAGLLASLPHSFLPGPAGWLRSRGDGIATEAPRDRGCPGPGRLEVPGSRFPARRAGRGAGGRARLTSCEKRAGGVSEYTWSQISSLWP